MNIKLEEYVRASRVRLVVDGAPMSALRDLVDAFVRSCDAVSACQDMEQALDGYYVLDQGGSVIATGEVDLEAEIDAAEQQTAEQPQKRKRRTKAEMLAAREATQEPARVEDEPDLPLGDKEPAGESSAPIMAAENGTTSTLSSASNAAAPSGPQDEPQVTDTELQRFCGRLAQHFGGAQKVFDLSAGFVPEGAVARPTNIKDNSQRWAFIRHAEAESGVKYHG